MNMLIENCNKIIYKIAKKLKKKVILFIFIIFFIFNSSIKETHCLPLPFNFMMKPYIGVDFLLGGRFFNFHTATKESFTNSIYQFYNMQFNAGLRIHRNFGLEFFVSRWNYKISPMGESPMSSFKSDNFGLTANIYLQLPFTELLELLGTNIELYGLVGFGVLNGKTANLTNDRSFNQVVPKFGGGIQLRLLGFASVKFGVDYYHMSNTAQNTINLGNVMFYNLGFNLYFL